MPEKFIDKNGWEVDLSKFYVDYFDIQNNKMVLEFRSYFSIQGASKEELQENIENLWNTVALASDDKLNFDERKLKRYLHVNAIIPRRLLS